MSVLTAIADEFPLLAAIAHELRKSGDGNDVAQLRTARRMLRDAFRSLDHTPGSSNAVPPVNERRCCWGA